MKKIIFDTNFLIDCFKFKVDFLKEIEEKIEKPYKFFVTTSNLKELEKIAKTRKKESKYARIALEFVKKNCSILESKANNADQAILNVCDKHSIAATNDRKLRKSLKKIGIKVFYLKSLRKIELA